MNFNRRQLTVDGHLRFFSDVFQLCFKCEQQFSRRLSQNKTKKEKASECS